MVQFSGGFKINGGYDVRPAIALGPVTVSYLVVGGGGGGGYSGGGLSSVGIYNGQAGGGGSYIVSTATSVATSDGQYDGSGTFNGASITNLSSFNTTFGSVAVTSL